MRLLLREVCVFRHERVIFFRGCCKWRLVSLGGAGWCLRLAKEEQAATYDGRFPRAREVPSGGDAAEEYEPVDECMPKALAFVLVGHAAVLSLMPDDWIRRKGRGMQKSDGLVR